MPLSWVQRGSGEGGHVSTREELQRRGAVPVAFGAVGAELPAHFHQKHTRRRGAVPFPACSCLPAALPPLLSHTRRWTPLAHAPARQESPGLTSAEAGFLRLVDQLTNGSLVEINETGTALFFRPGILIGGSLQHDCGATDGQGQSARQATPLPA